MRTIAVSASKKYNVLIGSGLLEQLGNLATDIKNQGTAVIISDSNVWPIFGPIAKKSLENSGFHVLYFTFPAGEASKNFETYFAILNFMANHKVTRSDLIIALGGGVVGDISGFAAATYLRGISYIQVPTTLLAMVDSSVGGKTAIDLPAGKNLVGAFNQPDLVLCDISTLNSLPADIFRDGCAEVIKYGILYDAALFEHLIQDGMDFDREPVIARCVELKRNVVAEDEFDNGSRQMLNLGHTIGHGVEAQSNYNVPHGQAVAIGMAIVSKSGCIRGFCDTNTTQQIHNILERFGLPTTTDYTAHQLFTSALSDKKRTGETVNLIIPRKIGDCFISPTPLSDLLTFIEVGL